MKTAITFNATDAAFANIAFVVSTIHGLRCAWSSSGVARTATAESLPPYADRLDALQHCITNGGGTSVVRADS